MHNEEIDARIARIWKKMENLPEDLEFSCGKWPPEWNPPLSEKQVSLLEEKNHIHLPEDYRRFITTKAGGGTQPFYGLLSPVNSQPNLANPFRYTLDKPLIIMDMDEEEQEKFFEQEDVAEDDGCIFLCTEGCGMDSVLIVNTPDKDTYGTVWFFDLANDCGIIPILHPETKKPFCFLDWLEYWVDFTISHNPHEYFSYGELTAPFSETERVTKQLQ